MSRCYPFPPPGYVEREIIRDEPMIESSSIKGAKEEVKRAKNDRKHKKDKKRKERESESDISKKHRRHKSQRKDEHGVNGNKKVDDGSSEAEFLDKSCLTVELEHQSTSQNSCDSTLHSNESQTQLLDCRHYDSESGIRFLLPSKEDQDPEVMMMTNKDNNKLSSSQADHSGSVGKEKRRENTTKLSKERRASSVCSHPKEEKPSSSHQETITSSKLCRKCPPSTAVRFLNLIENWAPDLVESKLTTDSEDQEWWLLVKFGAERHHQVSNQTTIKGSGSMVWPTARFLPEVELHALPFTVPF
ncbi:unnamed protein product [Microthlaspi erraticum]|uniref:Uncharacterized protein n=1 Tax=Microthlaspi erraticum TaxID=1685480 RepID=A0A6D2I222_9BRAS|nr:unnamed protein product [Microthlaspi erraticum]